MERTSVGNSVLKFGCERQEGAERAVAGGYLAYREVCVCECILNGSEPVSMSIIAARREGRIKSAFPEWGGGSGSLPKGLASEQILSSVESESRAKMK